MITLKVEKYCHNCPDFEPDVEKDCQTLYRDDPFSSMHKTKVLSFCETTVQCQHRYRCEAIMCHLEGEKNKSNENSSL